LALSDLFARRRKDEQEADGPVQPSKVLDRFLVGVGSRLQPVVLDLGPAIGSNLTFFVQEVGCKVIVEDLSADIDRHVLAGKLEELPAFFDKRFPQETETVDGILCWELFDYLDRPAAERLARQLKRVLRPDGMLLAFFGTSDPRSVSRPTYTKHVVVDRTHLQPRTYTAARGKQRPLVNRDIQRLFEPLRITENVLLKSNLREVLFRKPAAVLASSTAPPRAE
jgi:SAM-dependent methyltransferase